MATMAVTELVAKMGLDASEFEKGLLQAQAAFATAIQNITGSISGPLAVALDSFKATGAALSPTVDTSGAEGKIDGLRLVREEMEKARIGADDLDRGVRKVGQTVNKLPDQASAGLGRMQSVFQRTVSNITGLISGPLTAALGAIGSGAAINQYISQADSIGKLADSIGIDIEALQAWGEAAERAGGSASGFQQTVKGLNQRLQEVANGTGEGIKKTMESIGISATDSNGKIKDTLEVLRELAEKSEGMEKQKFVGLAQKLGIDSGTIMLLQSGKNTLDDLIKRQQALGVYTKEDAEIASKANDAFADIQQALKAFAAIIARVIVPGITFMTSKLVDFVSYIKEHKEFVLTAIVAIATAITVSMIPALTRMGIAALRAIAPFAPFIAAGLALGLVIDDLVTYIEGGESALGEFWSMFGTGPEIAEALSVAWEDLKSIGVGLFNALLDGIKQFVNNFRQAFSGLGDMILGVIKAIKGLVTGNTEEIIAGIKQYCSGFVEWMVGLFTGVATTIYNTFVGFLANPLLGLFGTTWSDITNGLIAAFDSAKNAVLNMFQTVVDTIKGWIKSLTDMIPSVDDIKKSASGAWDKVTGFFSFGEDKKEKEEQKTPVQPSPMPILGSPILPTSGAVAASGVLPSSSISNDNKKIDNSTHTATFNNTFNIDGSRSSMDVASDVDSKLRSQSNMYAAKTETGTSQS